MFKRLIPVFALVVSFGGVASISDVKAQTSQLTEVCHGEFENTCKAHPYTRWEECSEKIGVRGADPKKTIALLCGPKGGSVEDHVSFKRDGNYCGYSWFAVRCY